MFPKFKNGEMRPKSLNEKQNTSHVLLKQTLHKMCASLK